MDIILNTTFNNPNLPRVELPGFYDDFGPDGGTPSPTSLGVTSREHRAWQYRADPWARNDNHTASPTTLGSQVAYTDAHRANGILRTVIADPGPDGIYGLSFRYVDSRNWAYFAYNPNLGIFLFRAYIDGATPVTYPTATPITTPKAGDTIALDLQGATVRGYHNDHELLVETIDAHTSATHHGIYASQPTVQFEDVEFVPH